MKRNLFAAIVLTVSLFISSGNTQSDECQYNTIHHESGTVHEVPEPATLFLVGIGMVGLGIVARNRKIVG